MNCEASYKIMANPAGPVCNLECTYCYYLEKKELYSESESFNMSEGVLEQYVKDYIGSVQGDEVEFLWQGGEPTLRGIGFFEKAIEYQSRYSKGKGILNTLQTNGTLLNKEWVKFLRNNSFLVGVSIDGPEHIHNRYRRYRDGSGTWDVVMSGVERMKNYGVEFNTLTALNDYSVRFPVEIYRFLKKIGSRFHQYIPVVERKRISGSYPLEIIPPCYTGEAEITKWSVDPGMYGEFLKRVFDEWVKRDVGTYFVQLFDAVLANYAGVVPGLCIYAGACANPVLEYNGDVYSCDHFVFPEYRLGNIMERSLSELVVSRKNMEFGFAKRQSLPYECRSCRYTDICNGGCLRNRILRASEQGKNKNYLCSGLKEFYAHTEKRMRFMLKEIQNGRAPAGIMDAEI